MENNKENNKKGQPRTERFIFKYKDYSINLVNQEDVDMIPTPSDTITEDEEKESGFWIELKGKNDDTLIKKIVHEPIRDYAEVRSDDPDHPFGIVSRDKSEGTFIVTTPYIKEAKDITIHNSTVAADGRVEAATEIARFHLRRPVEDQED